MAIQQAGHPHHCVFTMQDVVIAVGENSLSELKLENVNTAMTARSFPASPVVIDNSKHDWGNYVLCGYKVLQTPGLVTPRPSWMRWMARQRD
jgi:hypothetical protein